MGMIWASIDLQLFEHSPAEPTSRQHASHRVLNHPRGIPLEQIAQCDLLEPTRVARVTIVDLLIHFASGHVDLFGVDDDHVVAGINRGRVDGLVLTAQDARHLGGQAAQRLSRGIHYVPLSLDIFFLRHISLFHDFNTPPPLAE